MSETSEPFVDRSLWAKACDCGDPKCRRVLVLMLNPDLHPLVDGRLAHKQKLEYWQVQGFIDQLQGLTPKHPLLKKLRTWWMFKKWRRRPVAA